MDLATFRKTIWSYYKKHKRDLPWRHTRDPYKILVSEMMLQQTQVSRVVPKYKLFLKKFPTAEALAQAKLRDVLLLWQGLGYNRRALYLKRAAEEIVKNFDGKFPRDLEVLTRLPGIGPATAGDIMAFAWNIPVPVIETNIRSVFIHFFFNGEKGKKKISDKEIMPIIERIFADKTISKNPREWYYALFDYGAYLKKSSNPSRRSTHHTRQSQFTGSYREKRARVLRIVLSDSKKGKIKREIQNITHYQPKLLSKILSDLEGDGFIRKRMGRYSITEVPRGIISL